MQGKAIVVTDDNKLILVTQPVVRTWEDIRAKRLRLLSETDYTQMQDWTGDKQAWAEYRQQLRDIPQQFDDPNNVVWPWPPTK